jgi:hypothetical protein
MRERCDIRLTRKEVVLMSQIGTKEVEIYLKDFLFVYSNDHVPKF